MWDCCYWSSISSLVIKRAKYYTFYFTFGALGLGDTLLLQPTPTPCVSECVCPRQRTEHPPFWFSLPGNFTHWRLWVTDWGCNARGRLTVWCLTLMPSCHSQMCVCVCAHAALLLRVSMLILTWHSLDSPGALLFLDSGWRCVSSYRGSGKPVLSSSPNTHFVNVWIASSI